jgi:hypothetical protein
MTLVVAAQPRCRHFRRWKPGRVSESLQPAPDAFGSEAEESGEAKESDCECQPMAVVRGFQEARNVNAGACDSRNFLCAHDVPSHIDTRTLWYEDEYYERSAADASDGLAAGGGGLVGISSCADDA